MARLLSSILLVVCLVGSLQASYIYRRDDQPANELDDSKHCDPLEKLMEQLVKSPGIQAVLDFMRIAKAPTPPPKTANDLFKLVKMKSGLDPREHRDRHQVACILYGIKSLDDVSALIGVPVAVVERYYQMGIGTMEELFGEIETITTLLNINIQYNTWIVNTGFPTMPLKVNVSYNAIRDQMQSWQQTIMNTKASKDTMARLLDLGMNPFKFAPDFTAAVLTGHNPTQQVLKMLCIDKETYNVVQKFVTSENMNAVNHLLGTVIKIIEELDRMGLFNLKRA